jgi:hypothetical protein
MDLALSIIGIAFVAFCIWLGVRIVNRRERWAKWKLAATLCLPVLYVASFGPACWISSRADSQSLPAAYLPIGWLLDNSPHSVTTALAQYAQAGMPAGSIVSVPVRDGLPHLILN